MVRIKKTANGADKIVKSELIDKTWKEIGKNIEKNKVNHIINTFITVIGNEIKSGSNIKIEGFGSFLLCTRNSYIGKDVNSGEIKEVPETSYIRFKPSKKIKP